MKGRPRIIGFTDARVKHVGGIDVGGYVATVTPVGDKAEGLFDYGRGHGGDRCDTLEKAEAWIWDTAFTYEFLNPTITLDLPAYERLDLAIRGVLRSNSKRKHLAAITELKAAIDEIGRLPKNKNYGGSF
jgi:hypothetical protein